MTRRLPQVGDVVVILDRSGDRFAPRSAVGALGVVVDIFWVDDPSPFLVRHRAVEDGPLRAGLWYYRADQLCVVGDVRETT